MKRKVRHVKSLASCGMLRHAAACFKTPTNSSHNLALRHAAACCGMLLPLVPDPERTMETRSEKGKKIACHINITATHAHTTKGLWAGKAMGKGQRGQGRGKGEGTQ